MLINRRKLLTLMLIPCVAYGADATREQLQQFDSDIESLRDLLEQFEQQRSSSQNELQQAETAIGETQQKIVVTEQALQQEQQTLTTLRAQRSALQTLQQQQQARIAEQLIASYRIGQQNTVKLLLNQESPQQMGRMLMYYHYFNRARSEQIADYLSTIADMTAIEADIVDNTQRLAATRQALEQEHAALAARQQQRQQALQRINADIAAKDQQLQKRIHDRAELEALLVALEQSMPDRASQQPFAERQGKLPWPVDGTPSNRFGAQRGESALRWQGLLIPAAEGSEVQAIHSGRVVFADWLRGSGLLLIVDHGDGYMSLYGHNQSLLRDAGDWVTAGDAIATVGNSGGQQQTGLYFEIRHHGEPVDPQRWSI